MDVIKTFKQKSKQIIKKKPRFILSRYIKIRRAKLKICIFGNIFAKTVQHTREIYEPKFEDLNLKQFIHLCRMLKKILHNFGISLTSIRYEMESYIQVLEKHEDVFSNFNIHHLLRGIVHEIENGGYEFTEAVLWISRYIDFIRAIIHNLLSDGFENNQLDETTENVLSQSYDETLADYRDWTAQKTFKALIAKSPRKKSLIKKFMNAKPTRKELLIISMEGCVEVMAEIVGGLKATYEEANLEKDIEHLKLQHLFTFQGIEEAD